MTGHGPKHTDDNGAKREPWPCQHCEQGEGPPIPPIHQGSASGAGCMSLQAQDLEGPTDCTMNPQVPMVPVSTAWNLLEKRGRPGGGSQAEGYLPPAPLHTLSQQSLHARAVIWAGTPEQPPCPSPLLEELQTALTISITGWNA